MRVCNSSFLQIFINRLVSAYIIPLKLKLNLDSMLLLPTPCFIPDNLWSVVLGVDMKLIIVAGLAFPYLLEYLCRLPCCKLGIEDRGADPYSLLASRLA